MYALQKNLDFPENSFDIITVCQCFWYFKHEQVMPILDRLLNKNGCILILYMAWLSFEDKIAGESEKLVLKYSPNWSGAGETMRPIILFLLYQQIYRFISTTIFILPQFLPCRLWSVYLLCFLKKNKKRCDF